MACARSSKFPCMYALVDYVACLRHSPSESSCVRKRAVRELCVLFRCLPWVIVCMRQSATAISCLARTKSILGRPRFSHYFFLQALAFDQWDCELLYERKVSSPVTGKGTHKRSARDCRKLALGYTREEQRRSNCLRFCLFIFQEGVE